MKLCFFALLFLATACASKPPVNPELERPPVRISSFPSTVDGVSIPNAHEVAPGLFRGMAPWKQRQLDELARANVREILIFRNDDEDGKTVEREMNLLRTEPRFTSVVHIPMAWRDQTSFRRPCEQTIAALRVLGDRAARDNGAVYFHCTMGEDRTGYLAALYRIVFENARPESAFREEMCRWGYADGSPTKPADLVSNIHGGLTLVFLKMVKLKERGLLAPDRLDASVCAQDPDLGDWSSSFRCRK